MQGIKNLILVGLFSVLCQFSTSGLTSAQEASKETPPPPEKIESAGLAQDPVDHEGVNLEGNKDIEVEDSNHDSFEDNPFNNNNSLPPLGRGINIVNSENVEVNITINGVNPASTNIAPLGAAGLAPASSNGQANKVIYLAIADTDDGPIGSGARKNMSNMKSLLKNAVDGRAQFIEVTPVTGSNFTPQGVGNALTRLNADGNTTIFCFFSCHGVTNSVSNKHFLQANPKSPSNLISREDIHQVLLTSGAGQIILFSDSCADNAAFNPATPVRLFAASSGTSSVVMRTLLLSPKAKGFVSLNGAKKGEKGWYLPTGGLATDAWVSAANNYSGPISWELFRTRANTFLNQRITELRTDTASRRILGNQTSQTISFFAN